MLQQAEMNLGELASKQRQIGYPCQLQKKRIVEKINNKKTQTLPFYEHKTHTHIYKLIICSSPFFGNDEFYVTIF